LAKAKVPLRRWIVLKNLLCQNRSAKAGIPKAEAFQK
jgi:hypothetical protein